MYVIFPAEEVVELTLGGIISNHHLHQRNTSINESGESHQNLQARRGTISKKSKDWKQQSRKKSISAKSSTRSKERRNKSDAKHQKNEEEEEDNMATGGEATLRDIGHPSLNEALKAHNSVTFKLVRTGE
ncbi:hypothetical protein L9F63_000195 [Diploptera punctata]|uniref:Uncharacterized protein n=1 Tax=Diploptera punctata TaxID=6984 RepID=A0AAD8EU10_DIPPU|nr:hypothetical protein L9F63_000195 [Diploptera punctata]